MIQTVDNIRYFSQVINTIKTKTKTKEGESEMNNKINELNPLNKLISRTLFKKLVVFNIRLFLFSSFYC